jgi:diguanylate cyclase (GGDEF)-like protein
MPLHLILSAEGRILSAGATLRRLFPGRRLVGRSFASLFALRGGGRQGEGLADLLARPVDRPLQVQPTCGPGLGLRMRALLVPTGAEGRVLANLSFGIDVMRAVTQLRLSDADFAATELAKELLFTAEANATVTAEMRAMSQRLDEARARALEEAKTDPLTGLRNRRACDSILARLCGEGAAFALMHIDLDFFKQVNDGLGHAAGDRVLREVAAVLRHEARAGDCIARVGGDEFVVILPSLTDVRRLVALAERMIAGISRPVPWMESEARISASIGLLRVMAGTAPNPAEVLATADVALYAAKEAGRGRAILADDPRPEAAPGAAGAPSAA